MLNPEAEPFIPFTVPYMHSEIQSNNSSFLNDIDNASPIARDISTPEFFEYYGITGYTNRVILRNGHTTYTTQKNIFSISKSNKNSSVNSISCEKRENIQLFSYFKYFCFILSLCLYTCICTPFSITGSIHDSSYIKDISSINDNSSCVSNTNNNDESISLE